MFSIVTVTLNCAAAALQTAASVLQQTWSGYEYIVKDGGSEDSTVEALQAFSPPLRIVRQSDSGIYDAMNQSLDFCRGDYVCFLNAGDCFANSKVLQIIADYIRRDPETPLFYGDIITQGVHPRYGPAGPTGHLQRAPHTYSRLNAFLYPICQQAWFVRADLYQQRRLDTSLQLKADFDFFLHWILERGTAHVHVPAPVVIYAGGGASDQQPDLLRQEHLQIIARYYSPWERVTFAVIQKGRQAYRFADFTLSGSRPQS